MAVELSQESLTIATDHLVDNPASLSPNQQVNYHEDTEYELDQSDSLTFLYNLLYDDNCSLSKSDILDILNCLKSREETLPFSYNKTVNNDTQGVSWPSTLKHKFHADRYRIGCNNWFHNIPGSFEQANDTTTKNDYKMLTDFFKFNRFFGRLKLHITHFQLRNLVCCHDVSKGIFYPLSYFHDHNLEVVNQNFRLGSNGGLDNNPHSNNHHSFFRINRLMQDTQSANREFMKLDCIIDSRNLVRNSNSRISTLSCSNELLVSGTFEGDYVINNISNVEDPYYVGEFNLTNNYDGITNSIVIDNTYHKNQLIISSNDKFIRYIDVDNLSRPKIVKSSKLPFAVNCLALNQFNPHEMFISGDNLNSFVIDNRINTSDSSLSHGLTFKGQRDFSFSCDWSPANENYLLAGNQDGCVRIWDKRNGETPLHCWNGGLGSNQQSATTKDFKSGPVRNSKFSKRGEYVCWAESLDHVGLINVNDLTGGLNDINESNEIVDRVQSIDFVGKCTGLSFSDAENGYGEQLIIGVNDCPLGGILSYNLESNEKCLDFDFLF